MNIWADNGFLDWYQVSAPGAGYQSTQILNGNYSGEADASVTPEPTSLLLFGTGLAGVASRIMRRRRSLKRQRLAQGRGIQSEEGYPFPALS